MEFKKCERCGCFYTSEDNVCCSCAPKDQAEIIKLKTYFQDNTVDNTLNTVSINTGITVKNLNRHLTSGKIDTTPELKTNL